MVDFDVIIVGGGLVGLAIAKALSKTSINIAVIDEKNDIYRQLISEQAAVRASAINLASKNFFDELDIWSQIEASGRVLAFNSIDVSEKQSKAKLTANCMHYAYPNLGYIIENQLIINLLYQDVILQPNIHFFNHSVKELFFSQDRGFIELDSDQSLSAKLIIGADGANSLIRQKQHITTLQRPYRHQAIIATVKTELSHQSCARQIFYPEGIVAFLPLWQPNMSCLVWSATAPQSSELLDMDNPSFSNALSQITDYCLGDCQIVSERLKFPLIARYCPQPVQERLILIGDAAHTIHPLAGQGVNLGLQDAKQLSQVIEKNYLAGNDIGLKRHFTVYQLRRNRDVVTMLGAMQAIQDTFDGQSWLKKRIREMGMNSINVAYPIKKHLIKYALGL